MCNVRLQKISILTPWKVIGNSEGEGVSKTKIFFKEKYGAKLEFPEGWGRVASNQKNFETGEGGGMDIFWNNTMLVTSSV